MAYDNESTHPIIDGRPILIGDWLHCENSRGLIVDGEVVSLSHYGNHYVVVQPVEGFTSTFSVEEGSLSRIDRYER